MKTKLALALVIAIAALLFLVPACRRQSSGKRVIAVIPKGTSHFFWQSVHAGAEQAAKENGVEIMWKGPEHEIDYAAQINIVEDAINRRVDGIVLAPTHKDALVPIVERAQKENIPVAIFDSGIGTENYVSYIATNNLQGGAVAAERLAAKLGGKGKVAILGVKAGSVSTDQREQGFQDTIKEKYPGIEIVAFQYGDADRARSLDRATDILTAHPELNGFFASNESSTVGVVQALVGENGAGKSTLMKIRAGVYQPDAGKILLDRQEVDFVRPSDALRSGIAMIYQELSLAPDLTVAENIFLGREPLSFTPLGIVNRREMNTRSQAMLKEYGFRLDPRAVVKRLSAADRQLVEITRATVEAKRVLVMDEPTSSLTAHEVEDLFRLIRELKSRGLAIIYISHRLEELDFIAGRLTVLRDGRAVYSGVWGEISRTDIIRHMAGRELKELFPPRAAAKGETRLRVTNLTRKGKFREIGRAH